uniref:Taste receptor type 2 n=1 Tax=Pyxicephalus adspersus TaxID=30357 RepID=A0AAV2ZW34_PYXAD|nr:TPA: hypothetical protein GDO54_014769 [Pyxicephalus adspersus]
MELVKAILIFICISETTVSFFLNSCIALIHIKFPRDGVRMNPSDLIQLVMAVTNITMRGIMFINNIHVWLPIYDQLNIFHTVVILAPFHWYFNFWLIAWLSTHYCTTITNLNHQIFVWMKKNIPPLPSSSPYIIRSGNSTSSEIKMSIQGFNFIILACANICVSFSIILVSLVTTVFSLLKHVWNMKQGVSGISRPNVNAQVRAVRTMILLLLLAAIISTAYLLIFLPRPDFHQSVYKFAWLVLDFYSLLEASIIIQSSPKLRKKLLWMI